MHKIIAEIKSFSESHFGPDFYMDLYRFKTQSRDPFEKKTKDRFDLRTALYLYLKDHKDFVFEDVLDLRNIPQKIGINDKNYFSSLSHTEEIGVFVFDLLPIGVDFENRHKITKEIVKRVSQPAELRLYSDFKILWSIKEAAFKAIPFIAQPKTLAEIKIKTIAPVVEKKIVDFEVFTFSAAIKTLPSLTIKGIGFSNEFTQLAIARAYT